MRDFTIPSGALIVSGEFYAGWTWFARTMEGRVMRFFYYSEAFSNGNYQLVYFSMEEHFEQFKDDLEFWGRDRAKRQAAIHDELFTDGLHNRGGGYTIPPIKEEDKRPLLERGAGSATS